MNNALTTSAEDSKTTEAEKTVNKSSAVDNTGAKSSSTTSNSIKTSSNTTLSNDDEKTMLDNAIKQLCYGDCDTVQV